MCAETKAFILKLVITSLNHNAFGVSQVHHRKKLISGKMAKQNTGLRSQVPIGGKNACGANDSEFSSAAFSHIRQLYSAAASA